MIGKNNPFNLRDVKGQNWIGQSGATRGFCDFRDLGYGIRAAAIMILRTYRKKNIVTIDEIIKRFAPPSENNTNSYIEYVCNKLGVFPFDVPSKEQYPHLLEAMSCYEGNPVHWTTIEDVIVNYKITPYVPRKK